MCRTWNYFKDKIKKLILFSINNIVLLFFTALFLLPLKCQQEIEIFIY